MSIDRVTPGVIPGHYSHRNAGPIPNPCAGSNKPYMKDSFRRANRTGRCPECLAHIAVNPVGRLRRHSKGVQS